MKFLTLILCSSIGFAQQTFQTPDAAAQALIDAAAGNNTAALNAILGTQAKTLLTSGNPRQDQVEREEFASIAKNKHELQRDSMDSDRMILNVGSEDWPFPVPIVRKNGQWHFDVAMGDQVMKARRIGADELDAIEICSGYMGAQQQFAQQRGMQHYAQKMEELGTLVPPGLIQAASSNPKPYHGYYFAILTAQGPRAAGGEHEYLVKGTMLGGFGLVAWPAQYGVTGVHTFIVNQDGTVYEKDRGLTPAKVARYDPDPSWKPVY